MGIEIEVYDENVVAHVYGELSMNNIKDVDDAIAKEIAKEPEVIGLNCKYLKHIDSYAINHFVKIARKAKENNITIVMFDLSEQIKFILETINLDKLVPIESRDAFEERISRKVNDIDLS